MFLPAFLIGRGRAARRSVQRASHWRTQFLFLLAPLLLSAESNSAGRDAPTQVTDGGAESCSVWCWLCW